ncbi:hypothetical protein [Hymenobacter edaphi]|uniref:DUF4890 domain-containing protein n=1 Tax=Hymenobacter edaphi TaxID=2211146 RepID=A0A328BGS2_9BACT|nr:hypothetical protein [Hymenobacter edaphi]RAK66127.1 hypothetical protein DLM85_15645 [Hymenobacter edaphi]
MKKQLFSLALILGLAGSFAGSSFATDFGQDTGQDRRELRQDRDKDGDKDHKKGRKDDAQRRQQRSEKLAKELGLSSKQKTKVDQIFLEQQQQMQALRGRAQGADRSQLRGEAQRIHESTDKKLKDVLSKKQYAQFEAKRQERQKQMQQRRGQHDGRRGDFKQGRS